MPEAIPTTPPPAPIAQPNQNAPDTGNEAPAQVDNQTYEVKINGQVRRLTLEQMKARASLAEAANEKFQTAAERDKKYNNWKERAQKDAITALMDPELGLSRDQIRTQFENWYKENFIDPETLSPEERQAQQWKKENDQLKKEKEDRENSEKSEREQAEQTRMVDGIQREIIQTLENSGLPKTRFTANRIAFWMKQNLKNGYDAPQDVIVQQVKDERTSIVQNLISAASPEQLVEMLGDDMIKKLRKFDLGRIHKKLNPDSAPPSEVKSSSKSQSTRSMRDVDQYFNELRRSKK